MFVNASIHPPNELSVPRCYPDPPAGGGSEQTLGVKQYVRSKSVGGGGGSGGLLTASSPYSSSRHPMVTQKSLGCSPGKTTVLLAVQPGCWLGWSELLLFALFENRHIAAECRLGIFLWLQLFLIILALRHALNNADTSLVVTNWCWTFIPKLHILTLSLRKFWL